MFVADTNVLASFAAARGLELLLAALSVQTIYVAPAVLQEVQTGLEKGVGHLQSIVDLVEEGTIQVLNLEAVDQAQIATLPTAFGVGERESVVLARRHAATLLCNDRRVIRYCTRYDLPCLDLARLLRLIWLKGTASRAKVKTMIVRMEKIEHLVFKEQDRVFAPRKNG